jgi:hypothetical protein
MVFNATFNNISVISWRSVLLVEEIGVPGENNRPVSTMYLTNSPVVVSYSEKIKMKKSCEFESRSWRSALDTTLSDKVCQWLETELFLTILNQGEI